MTYEEYKQGLITELGHHIDEEHQRLIVIAEGTDNEEIALELMQPPVCSQSCQSIAYIDSGKKAN